MIDVAEAAAAMAAEMATDPLNAMNAERRKGVAGATGDFGWISCRAVATRYR